jgi:hypothetical protein
VAGRSSRSGARTEWSVSGDAVYLRGGPVRHAMWDGTSRPARVTEVLTPAGSERWFEELAPLAEDDEAGLIEACERHEIRFLDDQEAVTRLKSEFNLE